MVAGEIPFDREAFLASAQAMRGIGPAVMKIEGSTLAEIRRSLKVSGYIIFLSMLKKLNTAEKVRAIANSNDFRSVTPGEGAVLATLDFSETYAQILQRTKIKLYTIHRAKGLEFDGHCLTSPLL